MLQQRNLITEDEALRAIHLAESTAERERAQTRLTFDEAVGLQWALVERRYGELSESGPVVEPVSDGLLAAMRQQLPFELTDGQKEVLDVVSAELAASRPMNRMLQGEVGSGKTIVSVMAMLQMVDAGINARCWRRRKSLPPNMLGPFATSWGPWRWPASWVAPSVRRVSRC